MMKKYFTLVCLLICFVACKQDQLLLFESKDSIYFNNQVDREHIDSLSFTFANSLESVHDSMIYIPIKLLGNVRDYDREVNVQVLPTSTAKEGVHYQKLEKQILPANTVEAFVKVKMFRSDDLKDTTVTLHLNLLASNDFDTDYRYWKKNVTDTISVDVLQIKLSITDYFVKPKGWNASVERMFLGSFSRVKLLLICELFDILPSKFDKSPTIAEGFNYQIVLRNYLAAQKAEGNTIYDENGVELTVPN